MKFPLASQEALFSVTFWIQLCWVGRGWGVVNWTQGGGPAMDRQPDRQTTSQSDLITEWLVELLLAISKARLKRNKKPGASWFFAGKIHSSQNPKEKYLYSPHVWCSNSLQWFQLCRIEGQEDVCIPLNPYAPKLTTSTWIRHNKPQKWGQSCKSNTFLGWNSNCHRKQKILGQVVCCFVCFSFTTSHCLLCLMQKECDIVSRSKSVCFVKVFWIWMQIYTLFVLM